MAIVEPFSPIISKVGSGSVRVMIVDDSAVVRGLMFEMA